MLPLALFPYTFSGGELSFKTPHSEEGILFYKWSNLVTENICCGYMFKILNSKVMKSHDVMDDDFCPQWLSDT